MNDNKLPQKKIVLGGICVMAICVIAFCLVLRGSWYSTKELNPSDFVVATPEDFGYEIKAVQNKSNLELTGWNTIKSERVLDINNWVVLYNADTKQYTQIPTQMRLDDAATEFAENGSNRSFCGFFAVTNIKNENMLNQEICFAMVSHDKNTASLMHTGKTVKEVMG